MTRSNSITCISKFFEITNSCSILGELFFAVLLSCLSAVFLRSSMRPKLCFHKKSAISQVALTDKPPAQCFQGKSCHPEKG